MNIDFQPLLTLFTRANTMWDRQRMMSSRISTACGRAAQRVSGRVRHGRLVHAQPLLPAEEEDRASLPVEEQDQLGAQREDSEHTFT